MTLITNFIAIFFAIVLQTLLLSAYLMWAPKSRKVEESYTCWLVLGLRGIAFVFYCFIGLMFFDTSIKILFLGALGYGNITHHIASCVLLLILGFEFVLGAAFVAPTLKTLSTFGVIIVFFIYSWEISPVDIIEDYVVMLTPAFYGLIYLIVITLIYEMYRKMKPEGFEDKELWNFERKFKSIFNWKFNLVMWALVFAELMLLFDGFTLLFWL